MGWSRSEAIGGYFGFGVSSRQGRWGSYIRGVFSIFLRKQANFTADRNIFSTLLGFRRNQDRSLFLPPRFDRTKGERLKLRKLGTLQGQQCQCGVTGRVWGQSLTRLLDAIKTTTPPDAL